MATRRRAGHALIAGALALSVLGAPACGRPVRERPSPTAQDTATDREIAALVQQQADAWARGDAKACAATFTADGELVLFSGNHLEGRPAIEAGMARYLSEYLRGTRLRYEETLSVDHLGPDTVVTVTRGCVLRTRDSKTCDPDDRSTSMNVFQREDGAWKYAGFQNTRYDPLPT